MFATQEGFPLPHPPPMTHSNMPSEIPGENPAVQHIQNRTYTKSLFSLPHDTLYLRIYITTNCIIMYQRRVDYIHEDLDLVAKITK